MAQPLFFEPDVQFEKTSAEVQMPEDPNEWPHEIMDELYKQVPYIADFELDVEMDKVDAERGFGFGHVCVGNKTEAPMGTPQDQLAAAGIRQVRIPVIVKEGRLQPFDVLVTDDSKMLPLTEQRLRQAIFRPQNFDVTSKTPGDQSMIGQLYPPFRQNYGFGGGGVSVNSGMGGKTAADNTAAHEKYASLRFAYESTGKAPGINFKTAGSILEVALSQANESDVASFGSSLRDRGLKLAYEANPATHDAVLRIGEARPASLEKSAHALLSIIRPSVVQLAKVAGGYKLKTASRLAWEPRAEYLYRGEAVRRCGEKVVLAADLAGSATVSDSPGVSADQAPADAATVVSQPGTYSVTTDDGQELQGLVLPNLLDLDGQQKPIALFTDGQHSAVQADIAGIPRGAAEPMSGQPSSEARGKGVFFSVETGAPIATIPLDIKSYYTDPNSENALMAETFDGRPVTVLVQPHLQTAVPVDGALLVPETWQWLPLDGTEAVSLAGSSEDVGKTASLQRVLTSVELRGSENTFSIRGTHVDKLASAEKDFISQDDALFLLVGLGANPEYAQQKIAEASTGKRVIMVRVGHGLKTAGDAYGEAVARTDQYLSRIPVLRQQLWKEAAAIPDPVAVDTVLSLGFLNPENMAAFVGYLPVVEEAQRRLCELLIASRLGLKHVPTPALEKSVRATEEVIESLKELAFQE